MVASLAGKVRRREGGEPGAESNPRESRSAGAKARCAGWSETARRVAGKGLRPRVTIACWRLNVAHRIWKAFLAAFAIVPLAFTTIQRATVLRGNSYHLAHAKPQKDRLTVNRTKARLALQALQEGVRELRAGGTRRRWTFAQGVHPCAVSDNQSGNELF